jgi:hypothetical protein
MRANEFIDEDNLEEFSKTDKGIRSELEAKGYQYLGKGVDQTAYLEPGTGLVLKVFGTQGNRRDFSPDQKMFFTWYDYCTNHSDNPFLPRFHGHDSFMWNKNRYLMIRTEPLKKTQGPIRFALDDLGSKIRNWFTQYKNLTVKGFINSFQRNYPREYAIIEKKLGAEGMPLMATTLVELWKLGQARGYHWDLHGGNFMLRSDGTPIINDPWVWTGR